ncbi:phosphoglucomutase [Hymenobacter aquaticus]|uniref:Phosphoglucomutase n=1 Tax=Hymenobacter aquaticus TaxID=1867101 RepID=A0A4Z0Q8S3_9BACT|nr:phosphoglucomutase [Hymenobacter aquaticus]TGE25826.1 phosphoglucomutase [Hymenobacter aquaticus]
MSAETSVTTPFVPIAFGTDGWRGLLDVDMTAANVARVATALADYLRVSPGQRTAAVGYDGRRQSAEFAQLLAEILSGNGIEVCLADSIVTTPALAYAVRSQGLQVGVMVTASHNPAAYNGIKFKASYGGPFLTEETHRIEQLLDHSPRRQSRTNVQVLDFNAPYLTHLATLVDLAAIRRAQLPVLIDSMHGAGQCLLEQLLRAHGCPADTLAGEARADFGGRAAEPIEKNLTPLRDALAAAPGRYVLGLATDGDADRLGVLLETGEWLSAQETILLLADFVVHGKGLGGDLVKTSSVTDKLLALATPTRRVHDVQVGFKYICEAMLAHDVAFGAEESGGYGLKGHLPERDGLLSGLLVLEMLALSGYRTLGKLVQAGRERFGRIHYDRIDQEYHHPDRLTRLPALHATPPAQLAGWPVADSAAFYSSRGVVNGLKLRLHGTTRWLLLRASETEPLMRLYAEGQSGAEVAALLAAGQELLRPA